MSKTTDSLTKFHKQEICKNKYQSDMADHKMININTTLKYILQCSSIKLLNT